MGACSNETPDLFAWEKMNIPGTRVTYSCETLSQTIDNADVDERFAKEGYLVTNISMSKNEAGIVVGWFVTRRETIEMI